METKVENQSKNVFDIPKSITNTGKFLQFISTKAAVNFAIKIFFTPIRFKTPDREKMMRKSAKMETIMVPGLNKEVAVYTYGYSKKRALLVHGWSGRGTQLYAVADKLLEKGYMVYTFDAPAHGKSPGKSTMMKEFIDVIAFMKQKFGPFDAAVGHSLGGMALLNNVKQGLNIKKLVTVGSGDVISDIIEMFIDKLKLKKKIAPLMKKAIDKKFNLNLDDFSSSVSAKSVKIPTLVVHDTEDNDVPVSCAHSIRQNLENGELLITNNLGHRKILRDKQVIERISKFIVED
ncbi:alpha/beta fold hydrolase [Aureivirga sp. CE67]|uniref:alpha/beta fold hydrolase n=1 Tax=Aureivirga sp. CE67 TaxID=1788983 RepID=UPI0018CB8190|nr:alpha/beta hydrolase [Aureivirga sp. CE67]